MQCEAYSKRSFDCFGTIVSKTCDILKILNLKKKTKLKIRNSYDINELDRINKILLKLHFYIYHYTLLMRKKEKKEKSKIH